MDREKIVKSFQKLINRDLDNLNREARINKHFLKGSNDFGKLEKTALENKLQLKGMVKTKETISNSIDKLTKIEENQKAEMMHLNEQIKFTKKEYQTIKHNLQLEKYSIDKSDTDEALAKRLKLVITKMFMKVYVDEHSPVNMLRGFASNDFQNRLYPFEFETENLTKKECRDKLWAISKQTTSYHLEWENLFSL